MPHFPQLLGSTELSTHADPHVVSGAAQPPPSVLVLPSSEVTAGGSPTHAGMPAPTAPQSAAKVESPTSHRVLCLKFVAT